MMMSPPPSSSGAASQSSPPPPPGAGPKPKRPLSGYNLFYRYKRNKVVEFTSHPDRPGRGKDDESIIREVLSAPPGLEGVPSDSPLLRLPAEQLGHYRASSIKRFMEGKLFPNENARQRLHRKVHGMGFVEMGKTMRLMWGRADKLSKDVFCELADVGRARYRRLMAEYKRSSIVGGQLQLRHHPEDHLRSVLLGAALGCGVGAPAPRMGMGRMGLLAEATTTNAGSAPAGSAPAGVAAAPAVGRPALTVTSSSAALAAANAAGINVATPAMARLMMSKAETPTSPVPAASEGASSSSSSSSDDALQDFLSLWAKENYRPVGTSSASAAAAAGQQPPSSKPSRPVCGRRVSTDLDLDAVVFPRREALNGDSIQPIPVGGPAAAPRRVTNPDLCDGHPSSLFEPLPVNHPPAKNANNNANPKWGRKVSTDDAAVCLSPPSQQQQQQQHAPTGPSGGPSPAGAVHPKWGRRVSTDTVCLAPPAQQQRAPNNNNNNNNNAGAATHALDSLNTNLELRQLLIKNEIRKIQEKMSQNNSLLPPEMQVDPRGNRHGRAAAGGQEAYLQVMSSSSSGGGPSSNVGGPASSSPPSAHGGVGVEDTDEIEGLSPEDFMDFIGELDEALDRDFGGADAPDGAWAMDAADDDDNGIAAMDCVFGKPIFDPVDFDFGGGSGGCGDGDDDDHLSCLSKSVNSCNHNPFMVPIPMPKTSEPKTDVARTA